MAYVQYFRDLDVYKLAESLGQQVLELTFGFPKEEKFSLTDQIRRSSRSVGAQIAEAWAKRRYKKHFISKLTDANGELFETQHWVRQGMLCKYIDETTATNLIDNYEILNKKINAMINKSDSFCD